MGRNRIEKVISSCPICEKDIEHFPALKRTYCSRDCAYIARRRKEKDGGITYASRSFYFKDKEEYRKEMGIIKHKEQGL